MEDNYLNKSYCYPAQLPLTTGYTTIGQKQAEGLE